MDEWRIVCRGGVHQGYERHRWLLLSCYFLALILLSKSALASTVLLKAMVNAYDVISVNRGKLDHKLDA
ncbi:MAG: hypothetical protein CL862_00330 [Cyanobium sp. NAT70]|nr:hypothetical protein [Cyanobium sp. NAT70]